MIGSTKSNIYVTVTTEEGKKQHKIDHLWLISVEKHKSHLPGLPHKDSEPVHYSAVWDDGSSAYFINSHPLASEPDLSGNILVAEDAKASPEDVENILKQHMEKTGSSPQGPDDCIRQALTILQSNGVVPKIDVNDFMAFANTYASKRANREAPAMIPYHKAISEPHKKVEKRKFWVSHPMESSFTPKESRIEGGDSDLYGGLM